MNFIKHISQLLLKVMLISGLFAGHSAIADDHTTAGSETRNAMWVHQCSLNEGKSLSDVDKALAGWRKWKEEVDWNGFTFQLTPAYFNLPGDLDLIWINNASFEHYGETMTNWNDSGVAAQRAIDKVVSCKVELYSSWVKYFPEMAEGAQGDGPKMVDFQTCTPIAPVPALIQKHAEYVEAMKAGNSRVVWGMYAPISGVSSVNIIGNPAGTVGHMEWFPNMEVYAATHGNRVNNAELRQNLQEYYSEYMNCESRVSFNVEMLHSPQQ